MRHVIQTVIYETEYAHNIRTHTENGRDITRERKRESKRKECFVENSRTLHTIPEEEIFEKESKIWNEIKTENIQLANINKQ